MALPHIVLLAPRGEALRNFIYSDTLAVLAGNARVTLLSVMDDERILGPFRDSLERILPLRHRPESAVVSHLRGIIELAHFHYIGSEVGQEVLRRRIDEAPTNAARFRRRITDFLACRLAHDAALDRLAGLERLASWTLRPSDEFADLFRDIKPDLVFNCSHIHGPAAEQPLRAAARLGIRTAGFIFSWDNLTSRSRIHAPYDDYLVWHDTMRDQFLRIYPRVPPERVWVTGTPQFDPHRNPRFALNRAELCRRIGADPARPIVLYTTGMDTHFPEEHRMVELVARIVQRARVSPRPQLVVRTYVKGTSGEMRELAARKLESVVFPPVLWDARWFTPLYDDLAVYSSMLRHASVGINVASTVSLELLIFDKPVVNLAFDPPGSRLPYSMRYERHLQFDHYRPVAESGAVMVARSAGDLEAMILSGLSDPSAQSRQRARIVERMFGDTIDGHAGRRVAEVLLRLAGARAAVPGSQVLAGVAHA